MAIERERKFIVKSDAWRSSAGEGVKYFQGYISNSKTATVRIRLAGEEAFFTIKSAAIEDDNEACHEYEYSIPVSDAQEMLATLCSEGSVEKIRYKIPYEGNIWEVDEFLGTNSGLITAEVEFDNKNKKIALPSWIGKEVTQDKRYKNASLAKKPYSEEE